MKLDKTNRLCGIIRRKGYTVIMIYKYQSEINNAVFSHYRAIKDKVIINSKSITGLYKLTLKRAG